jgi:hypothetical protein
VSGWRVLAAMASCALALAVAVAAEPAFAHEARPAYLEIRETAPGRFDVLWRTPVLAGMRLPVGLRLPDGPRNAREPIIQDLADSIVERRAIETGPDGLAGRRIDFPGLELQVDPFVAIKAFELGSVNRQKGDTRGRDAHADLFQLRLGLNQ